MGRSHARSSNASGITITDSVTQHGDHGSPSNTSRTPHHGGDSGRNSVGPPSGSHGGDHGAATGSWLAMQSALAGHSHWNSSTSSSSTGTTTTTSTATATV